MSPSRIAGLALTIVILASCVDKPDHGPAHITGSTTSITSGASWYASPNGSWGAAGTQTNPWSLDYALSNSNSTLQAGDTVWLLPGTYNAPASPDGLTYYANKAGASGSPIVYREHSSGHAIINARIQNRGSFLTFWGFELTQTNHDAVHDTLYGIESYGPGATYINLVIHDANKSGIIIFWPNGDTKVYGCILYNNGNGNHGGLDHGIYVQNYTGTARIEQNAVFDNLAYGIHAYSGSGDHILHGIQLVDNVGFNNGTISTSYPAKGNIIVGDEDGGANAILVEENYMHFSGTDGDNITVGYHGNDQDMKTDYNRIFGGRINLKIGAEDAPHSWSSGWVEANQLGGSGSYIVFLNNPSPLNTIYTWFNNYLFRDSLNLAWWPQQQSSALNFHDWKSTTGLGTGSNGDHINGSGTGSWWSTQSWTLPGNAYEHGRGWILVWNYNSLGSTTASLSNYLSSGEAYKIYNVFDLNNPVATGTYAGSPVTIPLNAISPPLPTPSRSNVKAATPTGSFFFAFLVRKG